MLYLVDVINKSFEYVVKLTIVKETEVITYLI